MTALQERLRRVLPIRAETAPAPRLDHLEGRIVELEAAMEGLQDAVHREFTRHNDAIAELRQRMEPRRLARALSDDARRRGI